MRRGAAVVAAGLLVLGVSGCGGDESDTAPATASAADIAFAQSMIPHHEQAVEMADLALSADADASQEVQGLAEEIKAAQGPEIEQMAGWLDEWGAPTAMPGFDDGADGMEAMDHSGHDMGGMAVSGMMGEDEMDELARATGEEFDRLWLEMMIEHHEGAVAMAEQVEGAGEDPEVAALAETIITAQESEISRMQEYLAG